MNIEVYLPLASDFVFLLCCFFLLIPLLATYFKMFQEIPFPVLPSLRSKRAFPYRLTREDMLAKQAPLRPARSTFLYLASLSHLQGAYSED